MAQSEIADKNNKIVIRIQEFLIFVINSSNNMLTYLLQILLWIAYGSLHSMLASNKVKLFLSKTMGNSYRYYRLIYNLIAFVLLVAFIVVSANDAV